MLTVRRLYGILGTAVGRGPTPGLRPGLKVGGRPTPPGGHLRKLLFDKRLRSESAPTPRGGRTWTREEGQRGRGTTGTQGSPRGVKPKSPNHQITTSPDCPIDQIKSPHCLFPRCAGNPRNPPPRMGSHPHVDRSYHNSPAHRDRLSSPPGLHHLRACVVTRLSQPHTPRRGGTNRQDHLRQAHPEGPVPH